MSPYVERGHRSIWEGKIESKRKALAFSALPQRSLRLCGDFLALRVIRVFHGSF